MSGRCDEAAGVARRPGRGPSTNPSRRSSELGGYTRRDEKISMLYYPLGTPDARLTIAVGEKIGFHDVGALRGCERDVPPALQTETVQTDPIGMLVRVAIPIPIAIARRSQGQPVPSHTHAVVSLLADVSHQPRRSSSGKAMTASCTRKHFDAAPQLHLMPTFMSFGTWATCVHPVNPRLPSTARDCLGDPPTVVITG